MSHDRVWSLQIWQTNEEEFSALFDLVTSPSASELVHISYGLNIKQCESSIGPRAEAVSITSWAPAKIAPRANRLSEIFVTSVGEVIDATTNEVNLAGEMKYEIRRQADDGNQEEVEVEEEKEKWRERNDPRDGCIGERVIHCGHRASYDFDAKSALVVNYLVLIDRTSCKY